MSRCAGQWGPRVSTKSPHRRTTCALSPEPPREAQSGRLGGSPWRAGTTMRPPICQPSRSPRSPSAALGPAPCAQVALLEPAGWEVALAGACPGAADRARRRQGVTPRGGGSRVVSGAGCAVLAWWRWAAVRTVTELLAPTSGSTAGRFYPNKAVFRKKVSNQTAGFLSKKR